MNTKCWLVVCLVMLHYSDVSTQGCSNLRSQLSEAYKNNLKILTSKMRSNLPLQCIHDRRGLTPNQEILQKIQESQEESAKVTVHEILQQIFHIFNQNLTQTTWEQDSIAVFQNGLHQQVQQLGACLTTANDRRSPRDRNIQFARLRVIKYFRSINNFLRDKQYSLCAWEIVQMEVRQCFLMTNQLIQNFTNEVQATVRNTTLTAD